MGDRFQRSWCSGCSLGSVPECVSLKKSSGTSWGVSGFHDGCSGHAHAGAVTHERSVCNPGVAPAQSEKIWALVPRPDHLASFRRT